jgi:hypothetical protein
MNEYTLYKLICKKIVYLTDRSVDNKLLIPLLEEYKYLQRQLQTKMYAK